MLEAATITGAKRAIQPPAVEFVNALTFVLSLDSTVEDLVSNLRRGLLQLLNIREFSSRGKFVKPFSSYVLPDLICAFCNAVVDLDVSQTKADCDPKYPWTCEYCDHAFDTRKIQHLLIREAQCAVSTYQLQDLRCVKCKMMKQENMRQHCQCSGDFELTTKQNSLESSMHTLWAVAKENRLRLLEDVAAKVLKAMNSPPAERA